MRTYPKDLNGNPTTKEQWDAYELEVKNFENYIKTKRQFMEDILRRVAEFGIEQTRKMYNEVLDQSLSMDRPNEPGYYRANND